MTHAIKWLDDVEDHDYDAAHSYLSLHFDQRRVEMLVDLLRESEITQFAAKDIFRASGLTLLTADNRHVEHNRKKVESGKRLSPILLVRGQPLIVCDGFHRLSFAYGVSEDAEIPCKIA
ncbi:hypothetical protein [Paraburkholderia elongata]|uniref:Uncharacterized protein n=1 Tax=Paraburkholderia elongata TaxID=2675747 RepID=A0A972NV17_9BURK|nr:hypothetical protein [Paraburkholderia elongata]NPT59124.1 hypothetical protein [Paraburkholderia elongata]